jgi:THO complex subunit 4
MATKLDQSLEDILTTNRKSSSRGRGRRITKGTKARTATPVGGIKKSIKSTAKAIVPTGPAVKGESKVIVSNLVSGSDILPIYHHLANSI